MCGGSPLIWFVEYECMFHFCVLFRVGEITQGGDKIDTLILPSLNRFDFCIVLFCFRLKMSGRSTGEEMYILSFSPLCFVVFFLSFHEIRVGEIHRRGVSFCNSRSPTMNKF